MEDSDMYTNFTSSELEKTDCMSEHPVTPVGWCSVTFDGILCWPPTRPRSLATLPCREELYGVLYDVTKNATKLCDVGGHWDNYSDYTDCQETLIGTQGDVELTTVIYLAGYGLSLCTLILALFIFIYFKSPFPSSAKGSKNKENTNRAKEVKKIAGETDSVLPQHKNVDLRCLRNTIHTNLMLTYVLADFMWILNFSLQMSIHSDFASCLVLFTMLHYFHLTNFFWMFVEGLYLYMLVVETFTRENIKLRAYLGIGWGTPILIIVIWIIARSLSSDSTTDNLDVTGGGTKGCSWIKPSHCDWIYQVPAVLILIVNLLFLVRIMWVLITKLRSANNAETEQYRKGSKALLVLIPLLGITYILFIAGSQSAVYNNIRAFLLSTQGFTVGLLYCFVNTEVQNALRHRWVRWKEERSLANRAYAKDLSPNTRTESIRLFSSKAAERGAYKKRESTCSQITTTSLVPGSSRPSNGQLRASAAQSPHETV